MILMVACSAGRAYAQPVIGLYAGVEAGTSWISSPVLVDLSSQAIPGNFSLPPNVRVSGAGKVNFRGLETT
jgi:hypothetical protein